MPILAVTNNSPSTNQNAANTRPLEGTLLPTHMHVSISPRLSDRQMGLTQRINDPEEARNKHS